MTLIEQLKQVCLENLEYLEDLKEINYTNLKTTYDLLVLRSKLLENYYNGVNPKKMYVHEKLLYEASLPDYYNMTKIAFVCCLFFQQILVSEYTEDRYKAFMEILEESRLDESKNFIVYLIQRLNMQEYFVTPPIPLEEEDYMQDLEFYNDTSVIIDYDENQFRHMFKIGGHELSSSVFSFDVDGNYSGGENMFADLLIPQNKKIIYIYGLYGIVDGRQLQHRNYLINREIDGRNYWIRIDSHGVSPNHVSLKFDTTMKQFLGNYISCNDYTYAPGPQAIVNAGFCIFMPLFIIRQLIRGVPLEQVYKHIIHPKWLIRALNSTLRFLKFSVTKKAQ